MARNIHIYYLHYDVSKHESRSRDPGKQRPNWFTYELVLKSFLLSLNTEEKFLGKINLTIWYDGDPLDSYAIDLRNLITSIVVSSNTKISFKAGAWGSGSESARALHLYVLNNEPGASDEDLVYFLENDYLHKPGWLAAVQSAIDSNLNFDYLSLYDHADNYTLPIHQRFKNEMFFSKNYLWRTCFSTCYSKICSFSVFREDIAILFNYDDFICFVMLNLKGRRLFVATPGLSTHAMFGLESPGTDWDVIANQWRTQNDLAFRI
jgi:hypothetical protein